MAKIEANGIEIDFAERGAADGRPLVLIRGLGTQRSAWPDELLDALAERGFRVVTFDNRDVGLSSKLESAGVPDVADVFARAARGEPIEAPYTLEDMARDVVSLLDALSIETAHIAGISMGGMIAQVLGMRHGPRLRSLASIMSSSGNPELPGPTPEAQRALFSQPDDPTDRESVIRHAMGVQRVIGSPGYRPGEAYERRVAEIAYDRCHYPAGVARQMLAIAASGSRVEALAKIAVPSLVIHGADDPLVPLEAGRDTARLIPGAELLVVPGMGHDVVPGLVPILTDALAQHAERADRA